MKDSAIGMTKKGSGPPSESSARLKTACVQEIWKREILGPIRAKLREIKDLQIALWVIVWRQFVTGLIVPMQSPAL
jgi:hypothetical protein